MNYLYVDFEYFWSVFWSVFYIILLSNIEHKPIIPRSIRGFSI